MSFFEKLEEELCENYNNSVTENGAMGYRTTGKSLLDLNFSVASLRSASNETIVRKFKSAFLENKILAVKWLFFARDVRGGLGERRLFRTVMNFVADYDPETVIKLIGLVAEYGRFDDLWELLDNDRVRPHVLKYVNETLTADIQTLTDDIQSKKGHKAISLIAKWLPSVNASSSLSKKYARIIRNHLQMSEASYRKILSYLRKNLDVVERKMSANEWERINYETVPSRANLIYKDAFLRHDRERREDYLSKLERGEAKINASVLYPHDVVHKYAQRWYGIRDYDSTIEALWKSLPDVESVGNTIVVADGSGSMTVSVGEGTITALEVANSLAIYFAEHSTGEFHDKYITFSSCPQLVDFSSVTSLHDKIEIALEHNEVSNTNIEAVFDLILETAKRNNMSQKDIPSNILIISDMEFDSATTMYRAGHETQQRLFDVIKTKYEKAGYKLPRLVFWNVNSRTNTIPIRQNEMGVALVSGFSVNICKMIMSGKTDPFECLLETLNSERYQPIEDALR